MMKLIFNGKEIECDKAIKGTDFVQAVIGKEMVYQFSGISSFEGYQLQDENGNAVEFETPQTTIEERVTTIETDQAEIISILSEVLI